MTPQQKVFTLMTKILTSAVQVVCARCRDTWPHHTLPYVWLTYDRIAECGISALHTLLHREYGVHATHEVQLEIVDQEYSLNEVGDSEAYLADALEMYSHVTPENYAALYCFAYAGKGTTITTTGPAGTEIVDPNAMHARLCTQVDHFTDLMAHHREEIIDPDNTVLLTTDDTSAVAAYINEHYTAVAVPSYPDERPMTIQPRVLRYWNRPFVLFAKKGVA